MSTRHSDNTNIETVRHSSTSFPSDEVNDKETNNKRIMIEITVSISLLFVMFIIIIIILISLFVWRSHHRTGQVTVNSQNNGEQISAITNPMKKLEYFNIINIFELYPCIYSEYV